MGATSGEMRNMMLPSLLVYLLSSAARTQFFANHALWIALLIFHCVRSIVFRTRLTPPAARTFPASAGQPPARRKDTP